MSRFYPPGGGSNLSFGLYVVSGMLKNGSLIVSWSTGAPGSQQIDYGINDPTVPNQTTVPVDDQGQRIYTVFHEVAFPNTFVGTDHYFRVRSQNRSGKELVSPVYRVYVTERISNQSKSIQGEIRLELFQVDRQAAITQPLNSETNANAKFSDVENDNLTTETQQQIQPIDSTLAPSATQKTVMETNYNVTIE